ncbi:MAG: PAS domain-containing protein [Desulfobacterales bacterium]|nr:PAS domain-containing protein [Desulfobacterales bacterium]
MSLQMRDLNESNEFLKLLFDNITSGIFLVDKDVRIQNFNNSFMALFQQPEEKILGQRCGNAMGCVFAVEEQKECGTTSHCSTCQLRQSLIESFTKIVPIYRAKLTREFYIKGEKTLKYFQYTAKYIMYNQEQMVLVIVDDITEIETQKILVENRNKFIQKVFGRYLSEDVVTTLLDNPEGLNFSGEKRRITIMMTDLRGFTSLSEQLSPEKVVGIINNYLEYMTEIILRYKGTIIEFIGDAILALFGAPMVQDDHAQRAIACSIEMQQAMKSVNEKNRSQNLPEVEMGIGLNTGEVVIGNIGSEQRAKYAVVGSNVNLTSRIESYTIGGQILISENTKKDAEHIVFINDEMPVQPKGVKYPITIYDVGGIGGQYNLYLSDTNSKDLQVISKVIPIEFLILEGKDAGGQAKKGSILKVSKKQIEIRTDIELKKFSNLKFKFLSNEGKDISGDIYGKVIDQFDNNGRTVLIHFTSMPSKAQSFLNGVLAIC